MPKLSFLVVIALFAGACLPSTAGAQAPPPPGWQAPPPGAQAPPPPGAQAPQPAPQAMQYGEYQPYWSYWQWRADPAVNQWLSARYDYRLEVDPRFRHYRMWKECRRINWIPLRGDCIASFDQYEPRAY